MNRLKESSFDTWRVLSTGQRLALLFLVAMPLILFTVALFTPPPFSVAEPAACAPCTVPPLTHRTATAATATAATVASRTAAPLTRLDALHARIDTLLAQLDTQRRQCAAQVEDVTERLQRLQAQRAEQIAGIRNDTRPVIASLERSLEAVTAELRVVRQQYALAKVAVAEKQAAGGGESAVCARGGLRSVRAGALIDAEWTNRTAEPPQWRAWLRRGAVAGESEERGGGGGGGGGGELKGGAAASKAAMRALLGGRWIMVYGDSTARVMFNTLLEAVGAPSEAQLVYGEVCKEFMDSEDSRDMCLCRVQRSQRDWRDSESTLRISFSWKEQMFSAKDQRLLAQNKWLNATAVASTLEKDERERPDVLIVNSGFHALHQFSADERVVFRGQNLSARLLLRYAHDTDSFVTLLRASFMRSGGCVLWRGTNAVTREKRLAAPLFAQLSEFTVPFMLRNGVHVVNATTSLSETPPYTHESDDGLHYESMASVFTGIVAESIAQLCKESSGGGGGGGGGGADAPPLVINGLS